MGSVSVRPATSATDIAAARALVAEYGESLGIDLEFQDFGAELATFPGSYVPPGGALLLGELNGRVCGCVGLRPLELPEVAELKRLYVRPEARGAGLGKLLTIRALEVARAAGYRRVRLDTLPGMTSAQRLYRALGFREIPGYRHNPVPGTVFLEYEILKGPVRRE
ncbi:MAG: GNAT family N-acetyltransferase [Gemmatimonadetes bacterium]|nr:GNAT family N-acetyltransferase [Gemmatimonadota bacterium]